MKAFIQTIARMTMDGEEIDGKEFIMENDDAVTTLNELISQARDLVAGFSAKPIKKATYPDPVPDPNRPGWWLYADGKGATMFISGKEQAADKARRAKMRRRFGAEERESKAYNWFPAYQANVAKARAIQERINEPYPTWEEGDTPETREAKRVNRNTRVTKAELEMKKLRRKIFR